MVWDDVDVYLGDERCVPPDHPDSNHRMVAETLFAVVGAVGSDHPMYRSGTPSAAAADYQAVIAPLPAFDFVHLGLGPDGHTASLFPGSAALGITDPGVLVVANQDPSATNRHDRITLTYPALARARLAVFTVSGASKRDAFAGVMAGADLPAGRVTADRIVWLVDQDAVGDTAPAVVGRVSFSPGLPGPDRSRPPARTPPIRCRRCPPTPAPRLRTRRRHRRPPPTQPRRCPPGGRVRSGWTCPSPPSRNGPHGSDRRPTATGSPSRPRCSSP